MGGFTDAVMNAVMNEPHINATCTGMMIGEVMSIIDGFTG